MRNSGRRRKKKIDLTGVVIWGNLGPQLDNISLSHGVNQNKMRFFLAGIGTTDWIRIS
jgi:hypothetical protein